MTAKKDIETRADIIAFVNSFYNKVETDSVIGYIFTEVAKVDWEHHLPRMYDFWESVLFGRAVFKGNPMSVHFILNTKQALETKEFEQWKMLFNKTIDELFEGELADEAKKKAASIANLMHFKISSPQSGGINIKR